MLEAKQFRPLGVLVINLFPSELGVHLPTAPNALARAQGIDGHDAARGHRLRARWHRGAT